MILLCFSRALTPSSVRMSAYSNFKFVSSSHAEILKPVKVNQSNLTNFLLKRHYMRPNTGERSRMVDAVPKGYELIYKEKNPSLFYTLLGVAYCAAGGMVWMAIDTYILKNPGPRKNNEVLINFERPLLTTKYDVPISLFVLLCLTISIFRVSITTPLRIYRKNDEIVVVLNGLLGPLKNKAIFCSINDIKPMATTPFIPFRKFKYSINGKHYNLLDDNFRSVADLNEINNKERLRTKLDDIMDPVQRWKEKFIKDKD